MGALMLLLAVAGVLWAVSSFWGAPYRGTLGSLSTAIGLVLLAIVVPIALVLGTAGILYIRAGRHARAMAVRTAALWHTGLTSLGLVITTAIVVTTMAIETGDLDEVFGAWRLLVEVAFVALVVHGVLTSALARPISR